jgi:hypothetical protein
MQAGSVRRSLCRGGAVSGAALFFALAAGSISLASAPQTPADGGLIPPATTPVSGTVDTASGLLPTPDPTPAPEAGPIGGVVKTVTNTVNSTVKTATDTVDGVLNPTPPPNGGGTPSGGHRHGGAGSPGGSTGSTGGGSVTHHHKTTTTLSVPVTPRLPREAIGATAFGPAGQGSLGGTTVTNPGDVTAAATPQLRPQPSNHLPSLGDLGEHSLPASIIVIAVTAVAAIAASHIGVWQNRPRFVEY